MSNIYYLATSRGFYKEDFPHFTSNIRSAAPFTSFVEAEKAFSKVLHSAPAKPYYAVLAIATPYAQELIADEY